jgi:hypothetical protein
MPAMPESHDEPRLPDDFTVEDLVGAPLDPSARHPAEPWREPPEEEPPEGEPAEDRAAREARGALWEIDFALQELEWLGRGVARGEQLVQSIVSQILYAVQSVERAPPAEEVLPDELRGQLADRFESLTDAIERMPEEWSGHPGVTSAHERLRSGLERRGVDVD